MPTIEELLPYVALKGVEKDGKNASPLEKLAGEGSKQPADSAVVYTRFIPTGDLGIDALKVFYDSENGLVSAEVSKGKERSSDMRSLPEGERYSLLLQYDPVKGGIHVHYQSKDYEDRIWKAKADFTNRVDKFLEVFQDNVFPGLRGFTYLGMGKMWRRDTESEPELVDVHEAIHTPDEYETRILTTWMLDRKMPKYKN